MKRFAFIGAEISSEPTIAQVSKEFERNKNSRMRFQFKIEHTLYILISMSRLRDPVKPETVRSRILFFQSHCARWRCSTPVVGEWKHHEIESKATRNRKSPKREWKMLFLPRFRRWLNCSEHVCECSLFYRQRQVRCSSLNKRGFGELLVSHLRQIARWNGNGSKVVVESSARNFHELIRSSSLISIITSKGTKRRVWESNRLSRE